MTAPLAYDEFGSSGAVPLLVLHGLHGDAATVRIVAVRFAVSRRVITPDALGHGRSNRPGAYTIRDQAEAVLALTRALDLSPVDVVGISMGSYIASQFAILAPDRVRRLVLVTTRSHHDSEASTAAYAARRGIDLATAPREEAAAVMADAMWSPDTPPSRRAELAAAIAPASSLSPEERRIADRSLEGFDLREGLASITAPTLVLAGRSDGINSPADGAAVAAAIPGARFEEYAHSAHRLPYEELERFVAEVDAFLGPIAAPTGAAR